jgi:acyl-CoA thioester hydrolase
VTVQFDEVDQYGIVHHPRYLVYLERARVDLMGRLGMRPGTSDHGLVVVEARLRYRASARFLDQLTVRQGCRSAGASRIELAYRVHRGGTAICDAELVLAFVDPSGRPVRASEPVRLGLRSMGVPGQDEGSL